MECVQKMFLIQRDGRDVRKLQMTGFLPQNVWNDFISAQKNIDAEYKLIQFENTKYNFNWGPKHQKNIFSKAAEMFRLIQMKTEQSRTQQQRIQNTQSKPNKNSRSKSTRRRK